MAEIHSPAPPEQDFEDSPSVSSEEEEMDSIIDSEDRSVAESLRRDSHPANGATANSDSGSEVCAIEQDSDSNDEEDMEQSRKEREIAQAWRILDPAWLENFSVAERQERFLADVLRVLVTRLDPNSPLSEECGGALRPPHVAPENSPEDGSHVWLSGFLENKFEEAAAIGRYSLYPTTCLADLRSLVIYHRAQAMFEKMWRDCAEFCLLGFVMSRFYEWDYSTSVREQYKYTMRRLAKQREALGLGRRYRKLPEADQEIMELYCVDISSDLMAKRGMERSELDPRAAFLHDTEDKIVAKKSGEVYKQYLDYKKDYLKRQKRSLAEERMTDDYRGHQIFGLITPKSEDQDEWKGYAIQADIWKIYESGPFDHGRPVRRNTSIGIYETLCANIRTFCLHAGSINGSFDPLENIGLLQQHVASQKIYSTSDLIKKIQDLDTRNREQQKIITSLYFRHVLEQLPASFGSAKSQWRKFWKAACEGADKPAHPLYSLRENHYKEYLDLPDSTAESLYGVLSDNIHSHCDGKMEIKNDQWNVVEQLLLNAIAPVNISGGKIDWDAERARYGYTPPVKPEATGKPQMNAVPLTVTKCLKAKLQEQEQTAKEAKKGDTGEEKVILWLTEWVQEQERKIAEEEKEEEDMLAARNRMMSEG